jgi:hypothetical protein
LGKGDKDQVCISQQNKHIREPNQCNKVRKNTRIREEKLLLLTIYMILRAENTKGSSDKPLWFISEFSKIAEFIGNV